MGNYRELLNTLDGGHLLDVACGCGQFIGILMKNLNSYESITGFDIDENMLSEARKNFHSDQISFISGSVSNIPFPDESFDTVSISKGLHHLEDVNLGLHEMLRVLKRNGRIIINEMFRDNLSEPQKSYMIYHHTRADIDNLLGIIHNYTFLRAEIIDFVRKLNLKNMEIHQYEEHNNDPKNPELILEYENKMTEWLTALEGNDRRKEMLARIEEIKLRFRKYGIARPPQLFILGTK